jgi:replicative DNA helicase Mcm
LFTPSETELHLIDPGLRDDLLESPVETIEQVEVIIAREYQATIWFGLVELIKKVLISQIRASHLNRYISVPGIVQKIHDVKQRVVEGVWRCSRCGGDHHRPNLNNQYLLDEPKECPHCNRKGTQTSFKLLDEECKMEDIQFLEIQEQPEGMMGRHQPSTLECVLRPYLVRQVNPGDRLVVNGVLRSVLQSKNGKKSSIMTNRIVVYAVEKSKEEMDEHLTPEDIEAIKELAQRPDIIDALAGSIMVGVEGLHHVKVGLTLQLFGGVPFKMPDIPEIRGDIHIMLLGDPGMAKTQKLRQIVQLHPRGFYADGGSSSRAGMTAAAVKSTDGSFALEAGACVLADMGLVALDEIDKMSEEDSSRLNEVLESQRCTVRKAGTQVELNARCTVLAAANPKHTRFSRFEAIVPQVKIVDPATLDRFDVIFFMPDNASDEERGRTVDFLLSTGTAEGPKLRQRDIDVATIRKYVAYARERVNPMLSDEAQKYLHEEFMTRYQVIMKEGGREELGLDIGYRKVLGLKRLAQAAARIRLSEVATLQDAELAVKIMFDWSLQTMWWSDANELDMSTIGSGQKLTMSQDFLKEAFKVCQDLGETSLAGEFSRTVMENRLGQEKAYKGKVDVAIRMLIQKGWLTEVRSNVYRVV